MLNPQFASFLALSGGVGGAKLAQGLAKVLPPHALTIVANTADDFEHLGLPISPDLDTLMYTLAGINNAEQGWGLKDESWQMMEMLNTYSSDIDCAETWFQLGDKDIATHLVRSQLLQQGKTLTQATYTLCQQLGVEHTLLPMTNDPVRTRVITDNGELPFQHYFVREQCEPSVKGFCFDGIENAVAHPLFLHQLNSKTLGGVIICPSNPFVSIRPILELKHVKQGLMASTGPAVVVSPIVAGEAIKGPTAKMMKEMKMPTSSLAIAHFYRGLIDGIVIDEQDAEHADAIHELGIEVKIAPTVMRSIEDKTNLAEQVLEFTWSLQQQLAQCG
jgi:LPPG:FO 2-phospho-L-lactate transferase